MTFNLSDYQNHFNHALKKHFTQVKLSSQLKTAVEYSLFSKGKRLRPILSYLSAKTIDSDINLKSIDSSAIALECLHIYSLVHDDLPAMDNDDTRHHQPASHIAYGEDMAILVGDVLQSLAFGFVANNKQLSQHQRLDIMQVFAENTTQMVDGQALDIKINTCLNKEELENIYQKKTTALLSLAVHIGVIISKADKQQSIKLLNFAQALGLAYQIQDDVLDIISSNDLLGKNQGSDLKNQKQTFAGLLGVDEATILFRQYYDKAIELLLSLKLQNNELIQLTRYLQKRTF